MTTKRTARKTASKKTIVKRPTGGFKLTEKLHPYVTGTNRRFIFAGAKKFGVTYSQYVNALFEKSRTGKAVILNGSRI